MMDKNLNKWTLRYTLLFKSNSISFFFVIMKGNPKNIVLTEEVSVVNWALHIT